MNILKRLTIFYLFSLLLGIQSVHAQKQVNYDESEVPNYHLPELFEMKNGKQVESVDEWRYQRRPRIIQLFEENVYGQVPDNFDSIAYEIVHEDREALKGAATLKEVDVRVNRNGNHLTIRLNLFIPTAVEGPAPVFLLINHRDPRNIDPTRKTKNDFWPVKEVISRGYAIGAFNVGDVADDDTETYQNDVLSKLYPKQLDRSDGMRALSAWAWGAMRMMDYFERDSDIDEKRAAIVGHSRGGKAALWTGAQDQRWAITISNESGCGGAALSRRRYGETIKIINSNFPHWFTPNFQQYNDNESALPVDQHMLIGAIAPRSVYVASAQKDQWADPKGEFLALKYGSKVYEKIYQMPVQLPDSMPPVNQPQIKSPAGYHIRDGEHDLTLYDWRQFLNFADYHFE